MIVFFFSKELAEKIILKEMNSIHDLHNKYITENEQLTNQHIIFFYLCLTAHFIMIYVHNWKLCYKISEKRCFAFNPYLYVKQVLWDKYNLLLK